MLAELHVKNLALIEEAEVTFGPGLNILTGETGAGKSILLGSINLALGAKASRDLVRNEERGALVELVFHIDTEQERQRLAALEIETEDDQLIITRKIRGGRSVNRINGETCTQAQLRAVTSGLLDIHGQHEHQSLLYPERQLAILDAYGDAEIAQKKAEVAVSYETWRALRRELDACDMDEQAKERELSLLRYEIGEIETAQLVEGEEEELEKRYRRMANQQKIGDVLGRIYEMTGGREGAGDLVGRAAQEMAGVVEYDEALETFSAQISDIEGLLADFDRGIADYMSEASFSEEAFREAEERLDLIHRLQAKYGRTIGEIEAYLETQRLRLDTIEHYEERVEALTKQEKTARTELETKAAALTEARRTSAEQLAGAIMQELADLNFLQTTFEIKIEPSGTCTANGCDSAEFLISTNPGEPARPLAKIISGGELSRIMLAIKTLLADRDATGTLIFDEIDAGISGRTAQSVSEKLARIAQAHQVICITHLAQIAAMADHHFEIEKAVEGGSTISRIRELNHEESIEELARILGGAEVTEAARENAREMKALAESCR